MSSFLKKTEYSIISLLRIILISQKTSYWSFNMFLRKKQFFRKQVQDYGIFSALSSEYL